MNCWKALFAGAVLLAAAPRAMGANLESKERAAKKACLLGEVDKGAEILADLYVDTNDATYIYNQGRCFEQNGKNDQAVLRFKEYLWCWTESAPARSAASITAMQGRPARAKAMARLRLYTGAPPRNGAEAVAAAHG